MFIVAAMAGITITRRSFKDAVPMAGLTFDLRVCALELERKPAVIDPHVFPTRWIMTRRTVHAELPTMFIVRAVTGKAICGRACEDMILMASLASHFRVFAVKFENRKIVIEFCRRPAFRRMA